MSLGALGHLQPDADARLIAAVRARRLLYDPAHPRYSDGRAKFEVWREMGNELDASASACKARWNNIRDNYRKSLMRRASGRPAHAHCYKYRHMLVFMNKFFRCKDLNESAEDEDEDGTAENIKEDFEDDEISEHDDLLTEETHETVKPVFPIIKEIKSVVESEQQGSTIDCEYLEKKESVSPTLSLPLHRVSMDPVDAFLAGLSPTLKAMNPVHLSLAKAEIFAVVHKYEMKGLLEGGGWPTDVNPLP
ncbi:hypothetical protein MSG28_012926 [Choristoneura fumiferana]|uniref:Uncharacterized protein n=1 Tax=Choristoneura fumiferana TaxID=7141 RepID=A0ACC0KS04_CHOFU|nr:hypothetical protein MSG28_012926 [Choristoneura fumiferana]